jgi:hypothetical protein
LVLKDVFLPSKDEPQILVNGSKSAKIRIDLENLDDKNMILLGEEVSTEEVKCD